jgi:hypothetical protein
MKDNRLRLAKSLAVAALLVAMVLVTAGMSPPQAPLVAHCTGYVVTETVNGVVVSVNLYCSGTCDASGSCDVHGAGDFEWCACDAGAAGLGACVTIKVAGNPEVARCANLACPAPKRCQIDSVKWGDEGDPPHEYEQESCYCP